MKATVHLKDFHVEAVGSKFSRQRSKIGTIGELMLNNISRFFLTIFIFMACALTIPGEAQSNKTLSLMPMPATVQPGTGEFLIGSSLKVLVQGNGGSLVERAVNRFLYGLWQRTGIPTRSASSDSPPNFIVNCATAGSDVQSVEEDESYRLEVTSSTVHLDAPKPLGVLHGLQTFLQLVEVGPQGFAAPVITIKDQPRFPWRGLLIDVSRHFMPLEVVKRNLDGMEAVKFNVLHWHLSDDQGFRVESKKFPKLQQMSSEGMYYTQEQIKDLIEYAHDRGIRVVPEFDVPGHATSWFVAYPELASEPGPYQVEHKWGVFNPAMDPTREETYQFLDDFIGEMARLFPDPYFHIGGDEVNGKAWSKNPKIQEFKTAHDLKKNHDLQAWFNKRLQEIVKKHGKIMVGWDEILHPDLPKEIVVQSWRGQKSLAEAARQGYRGLLSSGYYLDLMEPASQHYAMEPLAGATADLTAEEKQRILGGEACMWAEYVNPMNVDGRIWPRAAVVAERLWSAAEVRDLDSMYSRLNRASAGLEWLGLTHQSGARLMLERLSSPHDVHALKLLADVLEPVKGYAREKARDYNSLTPLNRLVDSIPPESEVARDFAGMTTRLLAHASSAEEQDTMRIQLAAWRDNGPQLWPLLKNNALLQELVPVSQNQTLVATAGLQALDYLKTGGRAPTIWREQQLAMLEQAGKPQSELLNMIVPSVKKLVEATTGE
jgi:hexosaminidase